jgi:hypothetical protein
MHTTLCFSGFLTRAVYFSELELAEIYGSGQKTGKQNLQVFCPEPCISASSSLQKYTVRVKKPENQIFKFFDPSRVLQRARACRNIRFGSKNDARESFGHRLLAGPLRNGSGRREASKIDDFRPGQPPGIESTAVRDCLVAGPLSKSGFNKECSFGPDLGRLQMEKISKSASGRPKASRRPIVRPSLLEIGQNPVQYCFLSSFL